MCVSVKLKDPAFAKSVERSSRLTHIDQMEDKNRADGLVL